jgi:hypothetical protein
MKTHFERQRRNPGMISATIEDAPAVASFATTSVTFVKTWSISGSDPKDYKFGERGLVVSLTPTYFAHK